MTALMRIGTTTPTSLHQYMPSSMSQQQQSCKGPINIGSPCSIQPVILSVQKCHWPYQTIGSRHACITSLGPTILGLKVIQCHVASQCQCQCQCKTTTILINGVSSPIINDTSHPSKCSISGNRSKDISFLLNVGPGPICKDASHPSKCIIQPLQQGHFPFQ